jgi:hypothetical protein
VRLWDDSSRKRAAETRNHDYQSLQINNLPAFQVGDAFALLNARDPQMRTLGQLVICLLLTVPSARAAFGPWDLDIVSTAGAACVARAIGQHVTTQSDRLGLYLEVTARQLRAVAALPVVRELVRTLRVREIQQLLEAGAATKASRPCQRAAEPG